MKSKWFGLLLLLVALIPAGCEKQPAAPPPPADQSDNAPADGTSAIERLGTIGIA